VTVIVTSRNILNNRRIKSLVTTALIVEHNPGLEELVEQLTGEQHDLPTAALASDCPADRSVEAI